MKKFMLASTILWGFLPPSFASENFKNNIGLNLGYGQLTAKIQGEKREGDDFSGEIFYRRYVESKWGVELGYKAGFDGVNSILISQLDEIKDLSYSGPRLSLYGEYPLALGFNIYGKTGLTFYETTYKRKKDGLVSEVRDSNVGGELTTGLGWSYGHIGMHIEANYMRDSVISNKTVMFGLDIKF
uniref:Outer membrane protein beta-barrel domain-containing protein n=1 Tax=Vibrio cholerae O37 TaxID=185332 RepID=H9CJE6_VIBCL|nr:hypothetical protein [Vibrio cholerae O37]